MQPLNFPVFQLALAISLGIICENQWSLAIPMVIPVLIGLLVLTLFRWRSRQRWQPEPYFGWTSFVVFFLLGVVLFQAHQPGYRSDHIRFHLTEAQPQWLQLKIRAKQKPTQRHHRFIAQVESIDGVAKAGKVLLHVPKEENFEAFFVDERCDLYGNPWPISQPQNPGQFNYARYLSYRNITHQIYLSGPEIFRRTPGKRTLMGWAYQWREHCKEKLNTAQLQPNERAILYALLLGERTDIDPDLYADYAAAGAVHILAVSGLHVGILYLLIQWLLLPLRLLNHGRKLQLILCILMLWAFACFTGLSPSVSRAATMFTCFGFAKLLGRSSQSINTLILSFLLLIIINPNWLFQVGFQLSYAAVAAIVVWQPKLQSLWKPRPWLLRKIWDITTVSFTAQIGVLPLSLYYFHQFPGLFLLTNLLLMPFLGLILVIGILVIVSTFTHFLTEELALIFQTLVETMNSSVHWIAGKDQFIITDISLTTLEVLIAYMMIFGLIRCFYKCNLPSLQFVAISLLLMLTLPKIATHLSPGETLTFFHRSRKSLLGHRSGNKMMVFSSKATTEVLNQYPVKSYRMYYGIARTQVESLPSIFSYGDLLIERLDSLAVLSTAVKPDILWLTHSPKIHLNRWIDSLQPRMVVADGSNYSSYVKRWKLSCETRGVKFHNTHEDGALVLTDTDLQSLKTKD